MYLTLPMIPGVNLREVPDDAYAPDEAWMAARSREARPTIMSHSTVHIHDPQTLAWALAVWQVFRHAFIAVVVLFAARHSHAEADENHPYGHARFETAASLAIAIAIALPIGLWIGHTGRFTWLAVNSANLWRALPSLAVIAIVLIRPEQLMAAVPPGW